ncbi:hypothetical protein AAVH_04093 [Aphelenchoides avenae]|nr:hypothetical protein AAVH_04093 [Aphelenchus avenae]
MDSTQSTERPSAEPVKSASEANPLLPEPELASDPPPPPPIVKCSMPNVPDDDGQWKNVLMPLITPTATTPSRTGTDNWVTAPTHPYQSPPASLHATSPTAGPQGTRSSPQNAVSLRLSDSEAMP